MSFTEWEEAHKEIKKKKQTFACLDELNYLQIISSFALTPFSVFVFLFSLHFSLLRNLEIIRCIIKSLIDVQHIFAKLNLKK